MTRSRRVVALSGGVGGAKLALGLAGVLDPERLLIVANTGDDFEHLGLPVCPDLDTLMYTLAGIVDAQRGWGLANESWRCMESLRSLGAPDWFALGDRDLATHLQRAVLLREGRSLSQITASLCAALGVKQRIVPMCETPVRTIVDTEDGELAFQEYFVRERCEPRVRSVRFAGAEVAVPSALIGEWLQGQSVADVVICPSNPFLSVDPMLAVRGMRDLLGRARVVAVSPIVGGRALKGPAAKMMQELGLDAGVVDVARHYRGLVDGLVIDEQDASAEAAVRDLGMQVLVTQTVMSSLEDKRRLAGEVLAFVATLPA